MDRYHLHCAAQDIYAQLAGCYAGDLCEFAAEELGHDAGWAAAVASMASRLDLTPLLQLSKSVHLEPLTRVAGAPCRWPAGQMLFVDELGVVCKFNVRNPLRW